VPLSFPTELPLPWPGSSALPEDPAEVVVALDDDPTGTQTVHDVTVLTRWDRATLEREFASGARCLYLLTNSRGLSEAAASALSERTGAELAAAGRATGRRPVVVSRSDSTLRGHFPAEMAALERGMGRRAELWVLAPYFGDGGRLTVGDVHWVMEQGRAVPVGETASAADATFGFRSSHLVDWVVERSRGTIPAAAVVSLSLELVRGGGPDAVADAVLGAANGSVVVVNALDDDDLAVAVAGIGRAERAGRFVLARTAASYVRLRSGISRRDLLAGADIVGAGAAGSGGGAGVDTAAGGLVVVGSHVPRTNAQLDSLLGSPSVGLRVELDAAALVGPEASRSVADAAGRLGEALSAGEHAVLYTSRAVLGAADPDSALRQSRRVSAGVVEVVRALEVRPRFLVAKGGITSSDVATEALGIDRATVLGQVQPGVPVWRAGPGSRHPGLGYVVYPGNVGGPDDLRALVELLAQAAGDGGPAVRSR